MPSITMTHSQSGHCGYRHEMGLADGEISSEPCRRPLWDDHDRCVWHAKVEEKTTETFDHIQPEQEDVVDGAYLRNASLIGVDWFVDTALVGADLTSAELNGADFHGADLTLATLTDASGISTDFSGTNLEGAILTNADLRRATLENARLNGAVLTDVHISDETVFGEESVYEQVSVSPRLGNGHHLEAAAWAYRQLQQIYHENSLPWLARQSYIKGKDARRRLAWAKRNYRTATIRELSRWVTLYGSSPYRILVASFIVIVTSAIIYPLTGGIQEVNGGEPITYTISNPQEAPKWWISRVLFKSLYFSVVTFATLGFGDIQPIGAAARMMAGVETILGSLLTALLVFVLARIVTW